MAAVFASSVVCKAQAPKAARLNRAPVAPRSVRASTALKASFKVTLETPEGTKTITCADDMYILDAAEVPCIACARAPAARRCPGAHPSCLSAKVLKQRPVACETPQEAGIDLPYSCRAGACSSCAGKVEVRERARCAAAGATSWARAFGGKASPSAARWCHAAACAVPAALPPATDSRPPRSRLRRLTCGAGALGATAETGGMRSPDPKPEALRSPAAAAPPRRAIAAAQAGKVDQSDQSFLVRAIRGLDALVDPPLFRLLTPGLSALTSVSHRTTTR
jgi:hypothetical protein